MISLTGPSFLSTVRQAGGAPQGRNLRNPTTVIKTMQRAGQQGSLLAQAFLAWLLRSLAQPQPTSRRGVFLPSFPPGPVSSLRVFRLALSPTPQRVRMLLEDVIQAAANELAKQQGMEPLHMGARLRVYPEAPLLKGQALCPDGDPCPAAAASGRDPWRRLLPAPPSVPLRAPGRQPSCPPFPCCC